MTSIDRRTLLLGATALACSATARAAAPAEEPVLWEGERKLPPDFLGQHFHAPLATPSYRVGIWRSHDGPRMQWRDAHIGPDQFDWSTHDAAIAHYAALGLDCNYCLYGTPTWASTSPQVKDPYNHGGANSSPSSLQPVEDFVRALLTRYRGRIRYLEIWNEFNNTAGAVFWRGSLPQLAALGRAVYRTAKEVDPSVIVLSPSVTSNNDSLTRYLLTEDGAGGRARRWLDGVAIHPYRGYGWTDLKHSPDLELGTWMREITRRMHDGGLPETTPVYITEIGYHWAHADPLVTGTSPNAFANWIDQVVLRAATLGVRQIVLYSHTAPLIGNPALLENAVVAQAIDRLGRQLSGTTLRRVTLTNRGQYRATTSVGELLLSGRA